MAEVFALIVGVGVGVAARHYWPLILARIDDSDDDDTDEED